MESTIEGLGFRGLRGCNGPLTKKHSVDHSRDPGTIGRTCNNEGVWGSLGWEVSGVGLEGLGRRAWGLRVLGVVGVKGL